MKFSKLTSLLISAAMAASATAGLAVTASADELPADKAWTVNDTALMEAATKAGDDTQFGPVDGLSGYGQWKSHNLEATYTHNDKEYHFTSAWQAGQGNATRRNFYFTPETSCIVTVAYAAQAKRPVYIVQDGKTLATGEEGLTEGKAATITADIEDPSKDVYVYGGSSNKDIYGIFVDYYDPSIVRYQNVSGNISYDGQIDDKSNMKLVFKNTKEDEADEVRADFADTYSVQLRQNRTYDIYVEENGEKSKSVCVTLDTQSVSVAKTDKTYDIKVVDIAPTDVTGDVVVHDVYNDGKSLDLSNVELTFKSDSYEYKTNVTDNKINVQMMPGEEYTVTATGIDGYSLSPLSGSYAMAPGDTAPFKNILITENVDSVEYKPELKVGEDKEFKTITDAITAVKKMTREPGEEGRVTILVDKGTYTEQVIVDAPYITIKAADEANRPEIQWYYGIGYLYYSSAGNQYYSEDYAVAKIKKGPVTRWGSAVRITEPNVNLEGIIVRQTFNCFVSDAERADGVEPAMHNEYTDVNGKPDRTADGYDAMAKTATERAAAIAMDADYIELYHCDFISSQDTFYTNKIGYVKDCYIEGGTDYIFGGNSIVFEDCTLAWHGYSDQKTGGHITANKNGADPVPGTPNTAANGYLLKNCTITTSKYYPENQFAAGGWGRNWGGPQTQVVFDGVKVETDEIPSGWTAMGGDLDKSILYVNNVTDKNGSEVDVSGTTYNPNGTMSDNGYTPMAMKTYFGGTWVPAHYDASTDTETPPEPTSEVPTNDPSETHSPDGGTKISCVKITATYNDGVLQTAKVENVEIEPSQAVPSTDGDTKIMYWESLDNMKPVKAATEEGGPGGDDGGDDSGDGGDTGETVVPPTTIPVGEGVKLSADDLEQKEYTETIAQNGFYIGADASKDESGKNNGSVTVDAAGTNGTTIDGVKYTNRIKTGGAGDPKTGVRTFYFKVDSDCTMIMAATSSNSEERDIIVLHGDREEHLDVLAKASYRVDKINAGETVIIYSPAGGLNVYGISLTPYTKAPTYSWQVSGDNSGCPEGTELMKGLTTLFEDTAKNGKYITSGDNGSISSGVVTGTALKYVAPKSGTLKVTVNGLGEDKKLCVMAEGGKDDDTNPSVAGGGKGVDVTVSAAVTEGITYYIWAPGSKARFTAASLTEPE